MKTPYLIQRGKIRFPLNDHRNARLSRAINLSYMGSAEFEFGALPKSLRAIEENFGGFREVKVHSVVSADRPLRVFHNLSADDFSEYVTFLETAHDDDKFIRTKESMGFSPKSLLRLHTDFWWDIENHVMWSFDRDFMKRLPEHLKASFDYMNQ